MPIFKKGIGGNFVRMNETKNEVTNYEKYRNMLKSIDEEYRTTNINMAKYSNIMFAEAKLMESPLEQQNQVALYLFNTIKLGK